MSRLARNTVYNAAGAVVLLVLSFAVVKFVFGRLGSDALGLLYLNVSITAVVVTGLELGISATTVREVSANFGTDRDYVTALIRTASAIYWGLTAALAVAIYFASPWIVEHWINLQQLSVPVAVAALRVLNISAVLALPKVLYTSLFRGRQRMGLNNAIDVGMAAAQQTGTVLIILNHGALIQVALWVALCAVVALLLYIAVAVRLFGGGSLLPRISIPVLRRNAAFAGHMMGTSLMTIAHTQTDKVVIAKLLPLSQFGYYAVASSVGQRAMLLATSVAQAALPSLTDLAHAGDHEGLVAQYRKLHDFVCFVTVPIFTAIIFAAPPLFTYLLNPGASAELLLPMALLAIGFYMNGTMTVPFMLSVATGRPAIASRTNLWALLLSVPLTVALIFWLGLVGAGLAWIAYHLLVYFYMVPRVSRECLQLPTRDWFERLARPLVAALLIYPPAFAIAWATGLDTLVLAAGWVVASAVFTGLAYVLMGPELRGAVGGFRLRA